jgi:hypothetical protein
VCVWGKGSIAFVNNQSKASHKYQTLTVVLYCQEQCWNGTRIKEEPKDEDGEEPHEQRLDW